ncbi:MAG: methyltransferase domain-containing protein [Actinomycetota bacterium]
MAHAAARTTRHESVAAADADERMHDWQVAGEAWGRAAADWSCLYEHYAAEVLAAMLAATEVGAGTSMLDVACGAGLALRQARGCGAEVAGIDASANLIAIARKRNPGADVRLGSMFDLPWNDESFDAVISVNGIWGGCQRALGEMRRVARPGALCAISFWGSGPPLDIRPVFKVFAHHAPARHVDGMRSTNEIARPGVAERMLIEAGFEVVRRDARVSTIEWPDADTAWRAISSGGPAQPALEHGDRSEIRHAVLDALQPQRDEFGIYRFSNDHQFVIARVNPAT